MALPENESGWGPRGPTNRSGCWSANGKSWMILEEVSRGFYHLWRIPRKRLPEGVHVILSVEFPTVSLLPRTVSGPLRCSQRYLAEWVKREMYSKANDSSDFRVTDSILQLTEVRALRGSEENHEGETKRLTGSGPRRLHRVWV